MNKVLITLAILAAATVGFVAFQDHKSPLSSSNTKVTVNQWLTCLNNIETSCLDIINDVEAYKKCSEADKKFNFATNPINCPALWNFLNHPALANENINTDNFFEDCFIGAEGIAQASEYFMRVVFHPRYIDCSGV